MQRAGHCSGCGANVYLTEDGACVNGHGPECISNAYDVSGTPVAPPAPGATPAYPPAAAAPKKKRTGLIIAIVIVALLLLCGCGVAGILVLNAGSSKSSSSGAPAKADPNKVKVETALTLVKSFAKGDAAMMMSVMPAETVAAVDSTVFGAIVKSASESAAVLGKETWKGSSVTIATSTNKGKGSIGLKISASDPNVIESHVVRPDKSVSDSTFTLVSESGQWKVKSMTSDGTVIVFDAATLKGAAGN